MPTTEEKIGTHQKALSINLDRAIFGSFAEIGAGQEVARYRPGILRGPTSVMGGSG
jgi:hypothetical protein